MSKQYCFNINNPSGIDFDVNALKKFVEGLYIGKKKDQFGKDDKAPFVTIHARADNSVCILMTSRGKKNVDLIEAINRRLKSKDLQWKDGISLGEPYEFDVDAAAWWDGLGGGGNKPGKRWVSLRQRGPYFTNLMEPYEPLGASLTYDGKAYPLTPQEEKIASFYAKRKISEAAGGVVDEWTNDNVFNQNFWNDFKKYLSPEHKKIFKNFSGFGWGNIIAAIEADKASEMTEEEKTAKKIRNEERKREYGYAYLDEHREKVGNFTVEPQAIFYGRGENPNRGRVKKETNPEDVTINIGKKDPVPKPPAGHKWGDIVHDNDAVWLAKWNDSITGDTKYVMFSAEGRFKGEADLVKYEKARKLQMHIDTVREKYMVDAASNNRIKMQLGTVLYLIDHFGVRVGNERKEDEADTVGASTLRVDHVKLKPPNHVIFDFLGKDSIRFYKDLEVPELIYKNFGKLLKDKKGTEQVFEAVSSRSINAYLKEFDKSFSAKVFRTRLASHIMYEALKEVHIPKGSTKARTKTLFNKANAKVADVLNHTRNVSKKAQEAVKKFHDDLKEAEKEKKQKKKEKKSTEAIDKKIATLKNKIESKTDVLSVAINTSLVNYIDPRLIVSWTKKEKADITAIYTAVLMRKFQWALETTDKDWDWLNSPLLGNPELEPLEGEGTAVQISTEDKPPKKTPRRKSKKTSKPYKPHKPHKPPSPVKPSKPVKPHKPPKPAPPKIPSPAPPVKPIKPVKPHKPPMPPMPPGTYIRPQKHIGPGTKEDYELLLHICEDPEKYKRKFVNIPRNVMEWIYPFAKYAVDKGTDVKANEYIVQYYTKAYEGRPRPLLPSPLVLPPAEYKTPKKPKKKTSLKSQKKVRVPAKYLMFTLMNKEELLAECAKRKIECKKNLHRNEVLQLVVDYYKKNP